MSLFQVVAVVIAFALTAVAVVLVTRAVRSIVGVVRTGQPSLPRTANPVGRTVTMVKETMLHTRMLQWTVVGVMHWFVYLGFIVLSTAVFTGYFQLFDQDFQLPLIGHWFVYEWVGEGLGLLSTVGIVYLALYRQKHHPRSEGRSSRFYRSTMWQAYFVEVMALLEGAAILFIRGGEYNLGRAEIQGATAGEVTDPDHYTRFHFPISSFFGHLYPTSESGARNVIIAVALIKIVLAMIWLIVIARNLTMGVAWHRFTAWFNIWWKREPSGRTALGAMKPLVSAGKPLTLDDVDDLDEDSKLGVGAVEDFSWKNILDFSTCTECGRCQSQCPAWNTEKPLNPKLLITALRDATYAKAPYTQALQAHGEEAAAKLLEGNDTLTLEAERPLIGDTGDDWFYNPESGAAVIDPEVLWNCTSCGACVQQCPVDIEHVDHIMDMRRYAVLVESNFPAELNGLFKGLENKGNPWNMSSTARLDWAKGMDVKVVGDTLESLDEVDWLFWVGCAGAYEDRAKKTTRAVAELLDIAGVSFGVLGNGETCTGDPARRAGNEFVFQGLAQQNVEVLTEAKAKTVVTTCAHCFNTLKNEYSQFGIELEVVHHTQLLNRLVREGKLTPVADGAGAHKRSITYHDPCYIGRHNGVYEPPRELLQVLPGATFTEMERNSERSFCCGAGGARMWMEEKTGERINVNRTREAVGTGADQIAVGCPFCRVMLSDGLTAAQAKGEAREEVEVLDVAQMLLASVKGEMATKLAPSGEATSLEKAGREATVSGAGGDPVDDPTPDSSQDGGDGVSDAEAAALASPTENQPRLDEDDPTPEADDPGTAAYADDGDTDDAEAQKASGSGGSLFDDPSSMFDKPTAKPEAEPEAKAAAAEPGEEKQSGSLFDETPEAEKKEAEAETGAQTDGGGDADADADAKAPTPAAGADLGSSGSLFDVVAAEPETKPTEKAEKPEPATTTEAAAPAAEEDGSPQPDADADADTEAPTPAAAADLGSSGSLFDIVADQPETKPTETKPTEKAEKTEPATPTEAAAPAAEKDESPQPDADAKQPTPAAGADLGASGSLFDVVAAEPAAKPAAKAAPAEPAEPAPPAEPEDAEQQTPDADAKDPTPAAGGGDLGAGGAAAGAGTDPGDTDDAVPAPVDEAEAEADLEAAPAKPAAHLGSGGSMFAFAAPAGARAPVAQPAAEAAPEKPAAPSRPSVSMFGFAAPSTAKPVAKADPADPAEAEPVAEAKPEPEPEPAKPVPAAETAAPAEEPELTAAQRVSAAATAASNSDADQPVQPEAEGVVAATPDEEPEPAAETKAEAEAAPQPDPEPEPTRAEAEPPAQPEAEAEPPAEPQAEEAPEPPSSGATHTPKTDVDISGAGSLFDL